MSESPFDSYEESHETPVSARARVLKYGGLLTQAEIALKRARDKELQTERAYRRAQTLAQLSRNAPKVERGGSTVADKKAWVDQAVEDDLFAFEAAKVERQAAFDHYQRVDKQASLAQSILKSIDAAFSWGTGREEPPMNRIPR